MSTDRRVWLWGLVVEHARGGAVAVAHVGAAMLCQTGVDMVAVTLALARGPRETLYVSDQVAADLAELVLTLGEGPSLDASMGGPVLVSDLDAADSSARWPVFSPAAVVLGARAAFALPLRIGGIGLGVLDLYRGRAGPLSAQQVSDGLILADALCALLVGAADGSRAGLDSGGEPEHLRLRYPEVHQATGMVTVQLNVSATVALARLRAYAYANDRRLRDVARDVVARRLRFQPDEHDDGS